MNEKEKRAAAKALADKYISRAGKPADNVIKLPTGGSVEPTPAPATPGPDFDETVAFLAKLSLDKFDRVFQEEAKRLRVRPATLEGQVKKRRPKPSGKPALIDEPEADIEELQKLAGAIIDSQNVLDLFEKVWAKAVAGEQRNAKLLYLAATSRLFDKCMSAAIKGPSSAGKSQIRKKVLDFMPEEDVVAFTTLSEKALLYIEGDFPNKILSMGEAAGTDEQSLQDYLLRELISEGKLRYPVAQKIGNEIVTITVEKNGPVCFLVTTTMAAMNPENETRMLSLEIDDSGEQTMVVIDKVAEIVGLNARKAAVDYEPWQNFQRWLGAGNCSVVVPFARELGKLIPPRSVRLRRDFAQVLLAIKAHALIHRQHRPVDGRGQIIADIDLDYRPVAKLMGGIVSEASGTSVAKEVQETINAVKVATANMPTEDGATAFEIAKLLKLDTSSAWRRLRVAMNKEFVRNLEVRHRQPGRYRLTDREVEAVPLLPSPEEITACALGGSKTTQTRKRTEKAEKDQVDNVCTDVCMPDANGSEPIANAPDANAHANANPSENVEENATVCTIAPIAGGVRQIDPRQIDLEESIAEALASTPADPHADLDSIPAVE